MDSASRGNSSRQPRLSCRPNTAAVPAAAAASCPCGASAPPSAAALQTALARRYGAVGAAAGDGAGGAAWAAAGAPGGANLPLQALALQLRLQAEKLGGLGSVGGGPPAGGGASDGSIAALVNDVNAAYGAGMDWARATPGGGGVASGGQPGAGRGGSGSGGSGRGGGSRTVALPGDLGPQYGEEWAATVSSNMTQVGFDMGLVIVNFTGRCTMPNTQRHQKLTMPSKCWCCHRDGKKLCIMMETSITKTRKLLPCHISQFSPSLRMYIYKFIFI